MSTWTRNVEVIEAAEQVDRDSRGFEGEFVFDPEHTEDHGIGHVGEFHDFDDRLMYVPLGDSVRDDTAHCIIDSIEKDVAEPMCRMLNWAGGLARMVLDQDAEIERLQQALAASQQETDRLRALLADHGIAPNKPSSAEREARAGDDHFFEGDDCDCELCGEGYMHYLHAPDHKRDEQNKEGGVEP